MKIDKHFLQISVAAFVLSLVRIILRAVFSFSVRLMVLDMGSYEVYMFLDVFLQIVSYLIFPFLIFAVFYFMGKKTDLTVELRPILLALLIGNIASIVIGSIVYPVIALEISVGSILQVMLAFTITYFVTDVFVALAGLFTGNNRRKKLTLSAEPELT